MRSAHCIVVAECTAAQDGDCGNEALTPKVHSTAIHVLEKGQWLERYYQETPAK